MKFASRKKTRLTLEELFVYPVKGCPPLALTSVALTENGLAHDRIWQLFDAKGEILNYKNSPRLKDISFKLRDNIVWMLATDMPREQLSEKSSAWFAALIGQSCTLRLVADDPDHHHEPISLVALHSLDKLNESLVEPFDRLRFRPNLVVRSAGKPFAECDWRQVYMPGIPGSSVTVRLVSAGASLRPHMFVASLSWRRTLRLWPVVWGKKHKRTREQVSSLGGNLVFGLYLRPTEVASGLPGNLTVGDTLLAV